MDWQTLVSRRAKKDPPAAAAGALPDLVGLGRRARSRRHRLPQCRLRQGDLRLAVRCRAREAARCLRQGDRPGKAEGDRGGRYRCAPPSIPRTSSSASTCSPRPSARTSPACSSPPTSCSGTSRRNDGAHMTWSIVAHEPATGAFAVAVDDLRLRGGRQLPLCALGRRRRLHAVAHQPLSRPGRPRPHGAGRRARPRRSRRARRRRGPAPAPGARRRPPGPHGRLDRPALRHLVRRAHRRASSPSPATCWPGPRWSAPPSTRSQAARRSRPARAPDGGAGGGRGRRRRPARPAVRRHAAHHHRGLPRPRHPRRRPRTTRCPSCAACSGCGAGTGRAARPGAPARPTRPAGPTSTSSRPAGRPRASTSISAARSFLHPRTPRLRGDPGPCPQRDDR